MPCKFNEKNRHKIEPAGLK